MITCNVTATGKTVNVRVGQGEAYELPYYLALETDDGKSPFDVVGKDSPQAIAVQIWMPNGVTCGQCISFTGFKYVDVDCVRKLIPNGFSLVNAMYEDDDYHTESPVWHLVKK